MMKLRGSKLIPVLCSVVLPLVALGKVYQITTVDSGWYNQAGYHETTNQNYVAGYYLAGHEFYRDWFVFSLSGLPNGTITSASLKLYNPTNGYWSPYATETYQLGSVATPLGSLMEGTGGMEAFNSIGSGTMWASRTVSATDMRTFVTVSLNSDFNGAASALIGNGRLAIGGHLVGDTSFTEDRFMFGYTGGNTPKPILALDIQPIPEPSSASVTFLGLLALLLRRPTASITRYQHSWDRKRV